MDHVTAGEYELTRVREKLAMEEARRDVTFKLVSAVRDLVSGTGAAAGSPEERLQLIAAALREHDAGVGAVIDTYFRTNSSLFNRKLGHLRGTGS